MNRQELELEAQILKKINAKSEYAFKDMNDCDPSNGYMRNSPLQTALYLVAKGDIEPLKVDEYLFAAKHLELDRSKARHEFDRVDSVLQALGGLNPIIFKNITVEFLETLNKKQDAKKSWDQFLYLTLMHQEALSNDLWAWIVNNHLQRLSFAPSLEKSKDLIRDFITKKREVFSTNSQINNSDNGKRINRNIENNLATINAILEQKALTNTLEPLSSIKEHKPAPTKI